MARAACPAVIIAVFIILVHPFVIFFLLLDRKHFVLFQGDWIFCFLAPPYLLIVVCLAFFRAGSKNLPTCVFQVRFSPRKHGVRGNECQKRSVVSVWYAQNSLPFCTEVWYTTLTSCEDPTKMLMRVCTLLLMQPAPLTGTATPFSAFSCSIFSRCSPHPSRGQQPCLGLLAIHRTGCSTHPSRGQQQGKQTVDSRTERMQPTPLTGTATTVPSCPRISPAGCSPRPSRGQQLFVPEKLVPDQGRCSPHPSRGQQMSSVNLFAQRTLDAACTPHGDSNILQELPK